VKLFVMLLHKMRRSISGINTSRQSGTARSQHHRYGRADSLPETSDPLPPAQTRTLVTADDIEAGMDLYSKVGL